MDRELVYNDELTALQWALNSAVECHLHTVEVIGSNPIAPTNHHPALQTSPHAYRVSGDYNSPRRSFFPASERFAAIHLTCRSSPLPVKLPGFGPMPAHGSLSAAAQRAGSGSGCVLATSSFPWRSSRNPREHLYLLHPEGLPRLLTAS